MVAETTADEVQCTCGHKIEAIAGTRPVNSHFMRHRKRDFLAWQEKEKELFNETEIRERSFTVLVIENLQVSVINERVLKGRLSCSLKKPLQSALIDRLRNFLGA